jgi:hypothetical protein
MVGDTAEVSTRPAGSGEYDPLRSTRVASGPIPHPSAGPVCTVGLDRNNLPARNIDATGITRTLNGRSSSATDGTPAAPLDTRTPVDFGRQFIPEHLTPLAHTAVYRQLEPTHRLRYNQLQGLFFNEQIAFFETMIGTGLMQALLREEWPDEFKAKLEEFWSDELRHTRMFRDLNRRCSPVLYATGHAHFIRVAPAWMALLRWTTRHPRLFPVYLWLILLQEERSLYYSAQFIRCRAALEPHFVATHRAHLMDEASHVRCDQELLANWWPRTRPYLRRANARLLAWMVAEFFSAPKRGQLGVVDTLAMEFPELRDLLPELKRQMLALAADGHYQSSLYSRRITPRSFAHFDEWPEFRVLEHAMPGYRFSKGAAA